MTLARVGLAVAGGVAGYFASGGTGLGIAQGASLGYSLGGYFDPKQKVLGPRLADLKAPSATYGSPIAYIEGAPRVAGCYVYASAKREIATTEDAGKGGPGVESTTYTYEIDALIMLACNPCDRIRRVFSNGKLIWTNSDGSNPANPTPDPGEIPALFNSLIASQSTPAWRDMRFYGGGPDQLPDPVYEAAVGIGNAPAYRGRAAVFIEGMNLGNNGQLPVLTFEVCSEAELGAITDQLGTVPISFNYNTSALFASSDGSVKCHVGGGGDPQTVNVYKVEADGTRSILSTYTASGTTGFGNVDRSCGIFVAGDNTAVTNTLAVYNDDGVLLQSVVISGGVYGVGGPRYVLCGDDLVMCGFTTTSTSFRIYKISISTGAVTSVANTIPIVSLAIIGNDLWVKQSTGTVMNRFDLDTLTLDSTSYTLPASPAALNGNRLFASGGRLYYAISNAGATSGILYGQNADLTWEVVNPVMGNGRPRFGPESMVGDIYYSFDVFSTGNPHPIYRTSPAVGATQVPLDQVVERLCVRTGLLTAADVDVTALVGLYVRAMAVSQVSTTRTTLEMLMGAYLFDFVEGAKLKAVLRGGAPVATIPYLDLGASSDGNAEPLPKKRLNDIEIAARVTVKYANVLNDFQDGAESGDRLVTGSTSESVVEIALGLLPDEAKKVADVQTMDLAVSMLQIGPLALPKSWAAIEPTDVVIVVDADGSSFRARVLKATRSGGVYTLELVLDDATIINSAAETDSDYTGSTLVRLLPDTTVELLDIPILRDADNTPGFYAATQARGSWPGAEIDRSSDDVSYSRIATSTRRAVTGKASSALPNFTGGIVLDQYSTLTVDVGEGTLSSITNDVLLDSIANALLVGSEIVQFRSAALVSSGVYLLTGFLRGLRGTEWAMAGHVANERVVLLDASTLLRIEEQQADIGLTRYYKAVTFGKSIAGAASKIFTDTGVALKPFAPVNLGFDSAGNVIWNRRSRLSSRFLAAGVDVPLGEFSEAYDVELRDASNVLVSTTTVTTPSYTLPGSHAGFNVTVYQRSATVGRGYASQPLSV